LRHLRNRLEQADPARFYTFARSCGIEYGESFQAIQQLWFSDDEGLGWIQLPTECLEANWRTQLAHPFLLDGAFQIVAAAAEACQSDGSIYVMQSAARVVLNKRLPNGFWAHAVISGRDSINEVLEGDLTLYEHDGTLLGQVEGLCARRVQKPAQPDDSLYRVAWAPLHMPTEAPDSRSPQTWVILTDSSGLGRRIQEEMQKSGDKVIAVHHAGEFAQPGPQQWAVRPNCLQDFERVLESVHGSLRGILHCWSLDIPVVSTPEFVQAARLLGGASALVLSQAVLKQNCLEVPKIWFLTRGAQPVGDEKPNPGQALVWGFGRVLGMEHPRHWGGAIDLEPESEEPSTADVAQLLPFILGNPEYREIAVRGGSYYVPRLVRLACPEYPKPPDIRANATYVITGGMKGVGLETARWLAQQGAKHLVLIGRTLPANWDQLAVGLEDLGAQVHSMQCDVVDLQALRDCFDWISRHLPRLAGIVHAAAVINDGSIVMQSWNDFDRVLAPKLQGGWNLFNLATSLDLDFFLLYSSAASLLAPRGQSAYAAANAFLDQLARHGDTPRTLAVNWGHWETTGAATNPALKDRLRYQGVGSFRPEEAFGLLEKVFASRVNQAAVLKILWSRWQTNVPAHVSGLWKHLATEAVALERPIRAAAMDPPDASEKTMEDLLADMVARMAGKQTDEITIDASIQNLGIDSLMLISLRNQIEVSFQIRLPIVLLFQNITIRDICSALRNLMAGHLAVPATVR
jgi:acyl carrier protein